MTKETRTALLIGPGGLIVGLVLGLLIPTGGNAPDVADAIADPEASVIEVGGEQYVITPEAAAAAGYVPKPTYRVIEKAEADKLVKGMTIEEVQALFPDIPIVTSAASVQPLPHSEGNSWVSESVIIGASPEGQITAVFSNGQLSFWGWQESPNRWTFVHDPVNGVIQAIKEGEGGEQDW